MRSYVADFETTTKEDDCHVWAFAICEVGKIENITIGTTIDEFMFWCENTPENSMVYFHNLKFDGQFIIYWLLKNGFRHTAKGEDRATKTFNTLISDKGFYYSIEVIFKMKGKSIKKVTIRDSLKLIPLSVEEIADTFKLPFKKLKIDYAAHNDLPVGSPLTEEETNYIQNDVKIVAFALNYFFSQGLNRITIGSCAFAEYKTLITPEKFKLYFPTPQYHDDVRQSYKGGYTYLLPQFAGKKIGAGVVLDVNSLYSYIMKTCLLPFGTPIFYRGQYRPNKLYPLYTQMIRCQFELKPGKLPTIQHRDYNGTEYLTSSNDEIMTLCLNSIDLELFFENYNIYNLEYMSGWMFKGRVGLFDKYVEKWSANKIKAKEENNPGLYLISKLFLNALYGKFGTKIRFRSKIPYINEQGSVSYKDSKIETRDGIYIAMSSFITSYARAKTITAGQTVMDNYRTGKSNIQLVYIDTDSLHCISPDGLLPEGLEISATKLGAWKFERKFTRGKYLRQKCYIIDATTDVYNPEPKYKLKVTVAGMPDSCHDQVNFRNFKIGAQYRGKLQPEIVPGGVVLRAIDFTINP